MDHQLARILSQDVEAINVPLSDQAKNLNTINQTIDLNASFINNFKQLLQEQLTAMGIKEKPAQPVRGNKIQQLFEELDEKMRGMKAEFIEQIRRTHELVEKQVIGCVRKVAETITNMYEKKINELESKIEEMSKQMSTNRTQLEEKNEILRRKDDYEPSVLLETKRNMWKSYNYDIHNERSILQENKENQQKFNGLLDPKLPSLLKNHKNTDKYFLPLVKTIIVSNPPTEEGFGILKMGPQVVYKGFWKYRKFHGKGKLTLPEYSYDGSFKNGVFEGRGTFRIGKYEYKGEFRENQANGQGMVKVGGQSIWGRWEGNRLVERYC